MQKEIKLIEAVLSASNELKGALRSEERKEEELKDSALIEKLTKDIEKIDIQAVNIAISGLYEYVEQGNKFNILYIELLDKLRQEHSDLNRPNVYNDNNDFMNWFDKLKYIASKEVA